MSIVRKYPRGLVAFSIAATGVVTYGYSEVQLFQQSCSEQRILQGLLEIRSDVGLLNSQLLQKELRASSTDPPIAVDGGKAPAGVTTLGELLSSRESVYVEDSRSKLNARAFDLHLDQMNAQIDIFENRLRIEKDCFSEFNYSGILVFLQILFASIASFIAFIIGDLKGLKAAGNDQTVGRRPRARKKANSTAPAGRS